MLKVRVLLAELTPATISGWGFSFDGADASQVFSGEQLTIISAVSGCEPYAFTNQYLGPTNGWAGDSISGGITGTAGWMFRAVVEYFCGIQPGYKGLTIKPCLPSGWNQAQVNCEWRGKVYDVAISRSGAGYAITGNSKPYHGGELSYDN